MLQEGSKDRKKVQATMAPDTEGSNKDHVVLDVKGEDDTDEKVVATPRTSQPDNSFDNDLLHRAVHDAGRWAFGTIFVEVWVCMRTGLFRPEGGYWLDPVFHDNCTGSEDGKGSESCALCRLTDDSVSNYCPPAQLAYGEGLPGALWSDGHSPNMSQLLTKSQPRTPGGGGGVPENFDPRRIVWKNVKDMANDPDQPYNDRLLLMAEAGLGLAAAVEFNLSGQKGMVMYMARETTNERKLRSATNEAYLKSAADLIGATYALRVPRQAVVREREQELQSTINRVRDKILAVVRFGTSLRHLQDASENDDKKEERREEMPQDKRTVCHDFLTEAARKIKKKVITTLKKLKGPGVKPPPAFNWTQSIWSFVGALLTLLILTRLNVHLTETYGSDHSIILGPFGALMTLQYGLTAAPASQPFNAIVGQAVSLSIAIAFGYLEDMDLYLRQSFATATAIFCMVKFGITHPPAGAAALLFSDGEKRWINMGFMLVGNAIAIFTSAVINNLNSKRQYPTSYGLVWWYLNIFRPQHDEQDEKKKS